MRTFAWTQLRKEAGGTGVVPEPSERTPAAAAGGLSPEALSLYKRIGQGDVAHQRDEPGLDELLDYALVVPNIYEEEMYVQADPFRTWRHQVDQARQEIADAVVRLQTLESVFETLPGRAERGEAGIRYMATKDEANGAIITALAAARTRVHTAHPISRPGRSMKASLPRDIQLLERGLALRTIYADEARMRDPERVWAEAVTQYGAQVRTLKGPFRRMVLIDDAFVIVGDHVASSIRKTGWKVNHRGLVAFLSEVFDDQWRRAEPWLGEQRGQESAEAVTTPMTRMILEGLSKGRTQAAIAYDLGVSTRTLTNHLTKLYERLGFEPGDQFRLGQWWASSEERPTD
ncbi:LuxR C-terminal-related transcriptional regulator [Streptomyces sp. NPDC058486]|uniref:LuxR C-terminal-related transcriptional regulator n=1 Tax=unclassified Streptomyces TaxID=2593676 RepID=UPI003648F568